VEEGGKLTDTGTIKKLIEDRNANLMKWYAEGAVDKVAEVFSEDCWQMQPNSEPLVGREALRKGWRQMFDWGKCDFSLEAQDVLVSGFIAVERGKYVFRFSAGPDAPDEMSSYEDKGSYVALWKRENDGEWRLFWDAPVSELAIPRAT
jgi:ketosteroid isomerase-like protein